MHTAWWLAVPFLPLFPFSVLFVLLFKRLPGTWTRSLLLLIWPLAGILLLAGGNVEIPRWVLLWAVASALLYSFRALVIRELNLWVSYIAVSAWSVLWVVLSSNSSYHLVVFALGFSLPMALMVSLGGLLQRRFSAAYAGLYGGIAQSHPRLSAMLVFTLLAVIATPVFPGFFTMMSSIMAQMLEQPLVALGLLLVWLLWSWSGFLLLQGLVMGPVKPSTALQPDLDTRETGAYGALLVGLVLFGLSMVEVF